MSLNTIDLRAATLSRAELSRVIPRAEMDVSVASAAAIQLIDDVRERGEQALLDQAERLDRVRPDRVRIHADEITRATRALEPAVREALELAIDRVRTASKAQVPPPVMTQLGDGKLVGGDELEEEVEGSLEHPSLDLE